MRWADPSRAGRRLCRLRRHPPAGLPRGFRAAVPIERTLREARYGLAVSEPRRGLGELFAAQLAGRQIRSDRASLVVVEWRDPGGGGDPPPYIAPLHIHHEDDGRGMSSRCCLLYTS